MTDGSDPDGLSRRAALGAVGGLAASTALGGCLGGGGRETVVLTGVIVYNWTGESQKVDVTLSTDGSPVLETTETVPASSDVSIPREWSSDAAAYRLQVQVVEGSLGVDAALPDGTWPRGKCAWAEVDLGSPNRQREVGGETESLSAGVRLRANDEGPFGDECPSN